MPTLRSPRRGSLQFWPRKRASKFLPNVNWGAIISQKDKKGLKGFIAYKVGMKSAFVKNSTPHSMTKDKKIIIPVTILECPPIKIFSVRFYKNGIVKKEFVNESLDKELKKIVKIPKKKEKKIVDEINSIKDEDYDDLRVIVHSVTKKTGIKKSPDLIEIGLFGNKKEKKEFILEHLHKEISITSLFHKGELIDLRGLTKGKGFSGPVKRFGIALKHHKTEKGRRRPGSLAPWNPPRVTFRAPQAGQLGMFTRVIYNNQIIDLGNAETKKEMKNVPHFGNVKGDYLMVYGSVQGPAKRQLLTTFSLRESKKQSKKQFELIELR